MKSNSGVGGDRTWIGFWNMKCTGRTMFGRRSEWRYGRGISVNVRWWMSWERSENSLLCMLKCEIGSCAWVLVFVWGERWYLKNQKTRISLKYYMFLVTGIVLKQVGVYKKNGFWFDFIRLKLQLSHNSVSGWYFILKEICIISIVCTFTEKLSSKVAVACEQTKLRTAQVLITALIH